MRDEEAALNMKMSWQVLTCCLLIGMRSKPVPEKCSSYLHQFHVSK